MPQMKLIAAGGHVTGGTEKVLEGGHTVSVSLTNEVWGWGDNFHGQVGKAQEYTRVTDFAEVYTPNKFDNVTGKYYNREVLPVRVGPLRITTSQPSPPPPPPAFPAPPGTVAQNSTETAATGTTTPSAATPETNPEIVAIAAGSHHNVALLRTGEMFAWGDNFFGQLGLGYQSLQREPDIFHKTQEWRAPEMIDRPTRIEHFDYVTLETKTEIRGNVSVELEYTVQVTGKIEWELDARITQVDAGFFQSIALSSKGKCLHLERIISGSKGLVDAVHACTIMRPQDMLAYHRPACAPHPRLRRTLRPEYQLRRILPSSRTTRTICGKKTANATAQALGLAHTSRLKAITTQSTPESA